MAKGKGGTTRRAGRRVKAFLKRRTPRGGRMSIMFKTALAVTGAALVGGAALNMVSSAKGKPVEGLTAGAVAGGAGLVLAFTLGLFKGSRQFVTPVLAGAAAVGALNAFSGPIERGSANIAKALLGPGGGPTQAAGAPGAVGERGMEGPRGAQPKAQAKPKRASVGEQAIGIASSLAQIGAAIAQNVQAGRASTAGLSAADRAVAAAAGLDDYSVGSGDDADGSGDDDADGSEGLDDFAIIGSSLMGDDDE